MSQVPPRFTIQKLSKHGASNPIVARMGMQTMSLIQVAKVSEPKRADVVRLYAFDLTRRLLKIHDAQNRITEQRAQTLEETARIEGDGGRTLPFIIGLTDEVDTILVEAKSVVRDTLKLHLPMFGRKFDKPEASMYLNRKDGSAGVFDLWAREALGADSMVTKVVDHRRPMLQDVVDLRNASEHPEGFVGTLYVENFRRDEAGRLVEPTWRIEGDKPRPERLLLPDLTMLQDALLYFCEELLAASALATSAAGPALGLGEIPEAERDPKCPVRLHWVFARPPKVN